MELNDFGNMIRSYEKMTFGRIKIKNPDKFFCHNLQNLWQVLVFLYPIFRSKYEYYDLFNFVENTKIVKKNLKRINCVSAAHYVRLYCGLTYHHLGVAAAKLKSIVSAKGNVSPRWTCAHYYSEILGEGFCLNISDECMYAIPNKIEVDKKIKEICAKCECYKKMQGETVKIMLKF
jgi:hypothetical protein